MPGNLKRWDRFAKQELDPPPDKRVGIRWIKDGHIAGQIIDGTPWVDMDAWRRRDPIPADVDLLS
jgi:hypothetical protein